MESNAGPWKKGEPTKLRKYCLFLREKEICELDSGNILIPLDDYSERSIKAITFGNVYVWNFMLPDGSIVEFFLHTHSFPFDHEKSMVDAMKKYFIDPKKKLK